MQIKLLDAYCLSRLFPASTPVVILLKTGESYKNEIFGLHMQNSTHTEKYKTYTQELHLATLQVSICFVTLLGHCTNEHTDKQDTNFITCLKKYFQEEKTYATDLQRYL